MSLKWSGLHKGDVMEARKDDFIGVYHPFPLEDPTSWNQERELNKGQLDFFVDYLPMKNKKRSWWKKLMTIGVMNNFYSIMRKK